MARIKKTVVTGVTREQAEQAFADYASADAAVQEITVTYGPGDNSDPREVCRPTG